MKNARIHLIYLAIIGFWAYQYWTKAQALDEAVGSIEQFDKLFKADNEVIGKSSIMIKNEIDKQVKAYPSSTNMSFSEKAINILSVSSSMKFWLEKQVLEFTNLAGGFDKKDSSLLANRLSENASDQFFSNLKIKEIRDSLTRFQLFLNDVISYLIRICSLA